VIGAIRLGQGGGAACMVTTGWYGGRGKEEGEAEGKKMAPVVS